MANCSDTQGSDADTRETLFPVHDLMTAIRVTLFHRIGLFADSGHLYAVSAVNGSEASIGCVT